MAENVLPEDTSGSALLRVQASSKLAFGATTVALVALASSGTAVLVNHGTSSMAGPTALPGGALLPDGGSSTSSVVVDRAPGTYGTKTAAAKVDPTVKALRAALAQRAKPGKRSLIAPLVQLGGTVTTPGLGTPELVLPGFPSVELPSVELPSVETPSVETPAVGVPAVRPPRRHVAPTTILPKPGKPTKLTKPTAGKPTAGKPTTGKPTAGKPTTGGPSVTPPAAVTPPASAPIFRLPVTAPDRAALPHNGPVATPADRPDTVDADDQETRKGGKHGARDRDRAKDKKAERKSEGKSGADSEDASERSGKGKHARGRHSR